MELTQPQKEWLEALESGKYEQGRARLKQRTDANAPWQYCCLGVACELYVEKFPNALKVKLIEKGPSTDRDTVAFDHQTASLPDEVREYFGLAGTMGVPREGYFGLNLSLWQLNDGSGGYGKGALDFCNIAKTLRKNPEAYFLPHPNQ